MSDSTSVEVVVSGAGFEDQEAFSFPDPIHARAFARTVMQAAVTAYTGKGRSSRGRGRNLAPIVPVMPEQEV